MRPHWRIPNLRYTNLGVWLKYSPAISTKYRDKPYVLISDLFPGDKIRFRNIMALKEIKKSNPGLKWVMDNYTINQDLLGLAKCHLDMRVPVPFDILKYEQKIRAQLNNDDFHAIFRHTDKEEVERYRKKKWMEEVGNVKGVKL